MSIKTKIYFFSLCTGTILAHFILISSYLIKPNPYNTFYAYPFFQQNWSLFVPPPNCNYNLYLYDKESNFKPTDIFNDILSKHQANRLAGYELILTALSNSIHYFEKEAEVRNFSGGKVENDEKFFIVEKIAVKYIQNLSKKINIKNAKIILFINPIKGDKQRVYFN